MDEKTLIARIEAKTAEYLDFPSVVGHETPFLDHLARDFSAAGFETERHRNLTIVHLSAPGAGPVFCSHIDRHGVIMQADGDGAFAAFAVRSEKYGEMRSPSRAFFSRIEDRYFGEEMFAYDRSTGGRIAYGDVAAVRLDDTGAEGEGSERIRFTFKGLPALPAGTPIAFSRTIDRSDRDQLSGQLDNPLSAAILRICAEAGLRGTLVFAAEEEIGRSAAHILGWAQTALGTCREMIVVDTSPFPDTSTGDAGTVVLRRKDANGTFDEAMVLRLEEAAGKLGLPVLFKDHWIERANASARAGGQAEQGLGITELGRLITLSEGRITGASVQIPTVNYHSNRETTAHKAVVNAARLLLAL